jgi:hypothetical protein
MADDRLLAAVRRYWTRAQIDAAYQAIFAACYQRQLNEVTITGVNFEGENSQGTVTVQREDYLMWMEALEQILQEKANEDAGTVAAPQGAPITNFSTTFLDP